jgi:L-amino acid N-acyltransferase YncA
MRATEVAGDLALRPVTSSDIAAIGAMWERCSLATRIARFHAPVRDIPASYLTELLTDPAANIVADSQPGGDVVGLASLIRSPGSPGSGIAELGVLVEDAWQRRGIGQRLAARLISTAPARGITTLTASILAANAPVADLLRRVPGQFSLTVDGWVLNVRVCLLEARPLQPAVQLTPLKGKELLLDPHEARPRTPVRSGAVDHEGMAEDHIPRLARQFDHAKGHAFDDGFAVHESGDPVGR